MKLLTLILKESIEMTEILQFRCYFKFGIGLCKLMCTNQTTVTIFSVAVIYFKGSDEKGGTELYQCYNLRGRSRKFQLCLQILMTSFIDYVRNGKVLIHDKGM